MRRTLTLLLLFAFVGPALADTGRFEINQAGITAAGGFPFEISVPGSYVLTGNLVVSTDVSAIELDGIALAGGEVSLDLNGFTIEGSSSCSGGTCTTGGANGIAPRFGVFGRATLRNGTVRGFSGDCIALAKDSRVEGLSVFSCGGSGIVVDERSVALGNRVNSTGKRGIHMGDGSTFAHNTVSNVNLSGVVPGFDFPAISGGKATAGNFCDDGSCSPRGDRRFYLTPSPSAGSAASSACAAGFRVATIGDLWDPSALHYDTSLGKLGQGGALPRNQFGWMYTSNAPTCSNFTSAVGSGFGGSFNPGSGVLNWQGSDKGLVWCVEE